MAVNVRTKVTENPAGFAATVNLNVPATPSIILMASGDLKDVSGQAGGYGGQLMSLFVYNGNSTTARRVQIYHVPMGQTLGVQHKIFDETLPAGRMLTWQPRVPEKYKSGAGFYGTQDTGTDVFVKATAVEFY